MNDTATHRNGSLGDRNPVLLIHGIFRKAYVFDKMARFLDDRGWEVHRFNVVPNTSVVGLDRLALQIKDYVDTHFSPEQPIDLVGLSMGGLVSRYYLQRLGGIERVQRFITIASPHHGTYLAYFLPFIGCVQMRPGSNFLKDLNQDAQQLDRLQFTSIRTDYDFVIIPANSSHMPVGRNLKIPVFPHAMMVRSDRTLAIVENALMEKPRSPLKNRISRST
ncbi:lipase family alpha/beta hydrolase [Roseofilum casamattae]|uniref:Alpha/beta fold hydrolase n=1 Tax=Roseofilum casamattae BLCC-M143 TaxID=3022442 RepID=A0ABT7BTG1_9CYAN|nr:alpha/beta fold hydrolase [Roseofilum casamattae]MDJ1182476.1 alpha/beta fold hydrolase [Roseofilum casamattae BLCC-M143]